MTQARETLVSISDTPYYHVVSRCVRRTFLCGVDKHTGKDYQHRRQWIEDRIRILSSIYAIDICAYSVMSNHLHIVVKLCPEQSDNWTMDEILRRWTSLYRGPLIIQKYLRGEAIPGVEHSMALEFAELYRERLTSLSWFMKCLNEPIAREANKEDGCTGHFWEARFKSQALLTEEALLSCMAYVDLNPVRAAMAETPETSDYTSIKERLNPAFQLVHAVEQQIEHQCLQGFDLGLKPLTRFECTTDKVQTEIQFNLENYLELVDYTGRILHPGKRGKMPANIPSLLERLNLTQKAWLEQSTQFERKYQTRFARPKRRATNKAA
jgi:REP element-mobilizing transposase RayT